MECRNAFDETVVAREDTQYTLVLTEFMRVLSGDWSARIRPAYEEFLAEPSTGTRKKLIRAICTQEVPSSLKRVWQLARIRYTEKWGTDYALTGAVATAMLRFVCVALVKPLEYGLVTKLQPMDRMAQANGLSSIVQAFATEKEFNEFHGQYETAQELKSLRKTVLKFVKNCCLGEPEKDEPPAEASLGAVQPLLQWWVAQSPDNKFHKAWGRKMRRITDWRDSHKLWERGSDEHAWMSWSMFRGMLDPELHRALSKRGKLSRGLSAKLKPSKPVVKNGLSICAGPAKAVYARKEPIGLNVTFKNVSKKPITLAGSSFVGWRPSPGFTFLVKDVKSGKVRALREGMNPMIGAPVRLESKTIAPGESLVVNTSINRWAWYVPAAAGRKRSAKRQHLGPELLPSGEYQVTVQCELGKGLGGKAAAWIGRIEANPVSFKVGVKEAAGADRPGGIRTPAVRRSSEGSVVR